MKADDFGLWDVDTFEGCEIQCPECKEQRLDRNRSLLRRMWGAFCNKMSKLR
jgi:hypothetical protein